MQEAIQRMMEKAHPELAANLHVPRRAKVTRVRETPGQGNIADDFRPRYAATLQILDEHGQPDDRFPELHDVPMSLPSAGHESGDFAFPEDGAHVVVGFIDGSPQNPIIQGVLPHGRSLPEVKRGEKLRQHSPENFDGFDKDGSYRRHTAGDSTEDSLKRTITALEDLQTYTQSLIKVEADSTEEVGGIKAIKGLGGVKVHSGTKLEMLAAGKQRLVSPKTYLGSEGENVLGLLSELMAQVIELANVLSTHTHPTVGAIAQGSQVAAVKDEVTAIKGRLDPIKE